VEKKREKKRNIKHNGMAIIICYRGRGDVLLLYFPEQAFALFRDTISARQ
jgi:hypothetical protein